MAVRERETECGGFSSLSKAVQPLFSFCVGGEVCMHDCSSHKQTHTRTPSLCSGTSVFLSLFPSCFSPFLPPRMNAPQRVWKSIVTHPPVHFTLTSVHTCPTTTRYIYVHTNRHTHTHTRFGFPGEGHCMVPILLHTCATNR